MITGFDIETIPNPEMADKMPPPKVALGNLKDPVKIAAKQDEARDKQIDKMGLCAATGRVLCAGFHNSENSFFEIMQENTDDEEIRVVSIVLDFLARDGIRLVTWNGKAFDIPFVYKRAAILRIANPGLPLPAWTKRYDETLHMDLMKVWDQYQPGQFTSLDYFSRLVLNNSKQDIDYKDFPELMRTPEGRDKIGAYCVQDAALPYEGYRVLQGHLF